MNISISHILSANELFALNSILGSQLYSISYQDKSYLLKDNFGINISFPSLVVLNCLHPNSSLISTSISSIKSIKFGDFSVYNLNPNKSLINDEISELLRFNMRIDSIEIFQGEDEFYSLNNELIKLFLTSEFYVSSENKFFIYNISGIIISEINGESLLIKVDDYSIKLISDFLEINKFKNINRMYQNLKYLP